MSLFFNRNFYFKSSKIPRKKRYGLQNYQTVKPIIETTQKYLLNSWVIKNLRCFFFTISMLQLIFRIQTLLSLSYAQFYRLLSFVTFLCKTVKVLSSFEHCKRFTTVSDSPLHMSQNANFSLPPTFSDKNYWNKCY